MVQTKELLNNEATFYCQIDTHSGTKDYERGGRCVRLIGVEQHEYNDKALFNDDGVTTYLLDIDFWEFCVRALNLKHWRQITAATCAEWDMQDDSPQRIQKWYCVTVNLSDASHGYFYKTFSEDPPKFFGLTSLRQLKNGPQIPSVGPVPLPNGPRRRVRTLSQSVSSWNLPDPQSSSPTPFVFDAFHVGQGMCSLVHNQERGILLDVGAGKPVTRKAYQEGSLGNELRPLIMSLSRVELIMSHADSDHWRMLAWDSDLRAKIREIFVPIGAKALALVDKEIKGKIRPIGNSSLVLDGQTTIHLWRSRPAKPNSNSESLVAIFEREDTRVLAAGDYVYKHFASDGNSGIAGLTTTQFAAVVVPHHGDGASATAIVPPKSGAKAFFSAGTHQHYNHPTTASLAAHKAAGYQNISNNIEKNIRRVNLV